MCKYTLYWCVISFYFVIWMEYTLIISKNWGSVYVGGILYSKYTHINEHKLCMHEFKISYVWRLKYSEWLDISRYWFYSSINPTKCKQLHVHIFWKTFKDYFLKSKHMIAPHTVYLHSSMHAYYIIIDCTRG